MKQLTNLRQMIREEIFLTEWSAQEVIRQLGGNKFIAMTGAKKFAQDPKKRYISFKIGGGAKKSINYVRITLNAMDTYDIEFIRARGSSIKVVDKVSGVYNDQLQKIFTKYTGFYTHLEENIEEGKQYWLSPVGKEDDFGDKISDEIIDAKTRMGPWALMTPKSWKIYGVGKLGTGYGQRFKKQSDGKWLKVEG